MLCIIETLFFFLHYFYICTYYIDIFNQFLNCVFLEEISNMSQLMSHDYCEIYKRKNLNIIQKCHVFISIGDFMSKTKIVIFSNIKNCQHFFFLITTRLNKLINQVYYFLYTIVEKLKY